LKVLLYFEAEKAISASGIGRALKHQKAALTSVNIKYTTDPTDEDFNILHINTVGPKSSLIINRARKEGIPVIYHAHSTEEDFKNSFIFSNQLAPFLKKRLIDLYSSADLIITPTPYSKRILESYGIEREIHSISNGIDLSRFEYDEEKVKAFKKYFSLKDDDKVVLAVGLYFERKGLLDFVEVAKALPDYKFIWFGSTPLYLIPKAIRNAIENHPPNVIFPGYISGALIEGAFIASDVFFFPSYEETEGIVVLEALSARQEVIVRNIGVYDGWLVDQENCYMGNNNQEFVKLIQGVVEKKLPPLAAQGYEVAKQRSIDSIGQQLKTVYNKVLEKK
jgi:1,2-diacylglycerol-3-alpha-glucose alpha-1,2-glucosyltransferase